jgi:hypothetical protein
MTQKELVGLIKQLVKVEAENAVRNEMQLILKENIVLKQKLSLYEQQLPVNKPVARKQEIKPVVKNQKQNSFRDLMSDDFSQPTAKPKQSSPKAFSDDPILNEILNETYQEDEWKTMNSYDSDDAQGFIAMRNEYSDMKMESSEQDFGAPDFNEVAPAHFRNKNTPASSVNEMIPEDTKGRLDADELPDFLKKTLTRNYSALVKKQNEKKTGKGGLQ